MKEIDWKKWYKILHEYRTQSEDITVRDISLEFTLGEALAHGLIPSTESIEKGINDLFDSSAHVSSEKWNTEVRQSRLTEYKDFIEVIQCSFNKVPLYVNKGWYARAIMIYRLKHPEESN